MPLIMAISNRVYRLETGRVIAAGEPNAVRNDPKVIASYLGTDERAIQRSGSYPSPDLGETATGAVSTASTGPVGPDRRPRRRALVEPPFVNSSARAWTTVNTEGKHIMTTRLTGRRAAAGVAVACALSLAACSVEKNSDANTSARPTGASVPAIAPGVTADSVRIGIAYPDLASVRQFVNIDHGDYEATFNALINKINSSGGVNGRRIVPVYGKIDLLSPAAAQETCVKLTQDEKVFAVLGSFNADDPLCYVQTNKTAVIGGELTATRYARAAVPWFSYLRGGDNAGDGVKLLAANHAFADKKVAVIATINGEAQMKDGVLPALQAVGVTPVRTAVLDAPAQDAAAVNQQINVITQKFQTAGADTIVVVGDAGASFPKVLEQTRYRPQLLFTDLQQVGGYLGDQGKHDFSTLAGSETFNPDPNWNEPANQKCVRTVEEAIPSLRGKLVDPQTLPPNSPTPQVSLSVACQTLALFTAIADKAGKDLNYQTFQNAGFTLGQFVLPGQADKANYTRDTPYGALPLHLYRYDPARNQFSVADK
jgi:hypothetical protein